jgi:hypothetical protein
MRRLGVFYRCKPLTSLRNQSFSEKSACLAFHHPVVMERLFRRDAGAGFEISPARRSLRGIGGYLPN